MNIIIKKPLITEKTMQMANAGMYTFLVEKAAKKPMIEKAIENMFGVDVLSIKTVNYKEERKMQRTRRGIFTVSGFKKAIVKLKEGQKIDAFSEALKETAVEEGEPEKEVKEKKSVLKGTKVKIERTDTQEDKSKKKGSK